ncbi:MAG: hypothetical protein M1839_002570 [Geoglossum umbratile]|nr:MAG: hypothetical protein M1839_002570 [Geoglossum umbratile]
MNVVGAKLHAILPIACGRAGGAIVASAWTIPVVQNILLLMIASLLQPHPVFRCLQTLTEISWRSTGLKHGFSSLCNGTISQSWATILAGYLEAEFRPQDMVLFRIWERENYISYYDKYDEIYQGQLCGGSPEQAKNLAFDQCLEEVCQGQVIANSEYISADELKQPLHHIVRTGSRWRELVNTALAHEVLLMDQRQYLLHPNNIIGDIIEKGTDEEFGAFKTHLLSPESSFRTNCFHLSGVVRMIKKLANTEENSEIRIYLAEEIGLRITEALGESVRSTNSDPERELKVVRSGDPNERTIEVRFLEAAAEPLENYHLDPNRKVMLVYNPQQHLNLDIFGIVIRGWKNRKGKVAAVHASGSQAGGSEEAYCGSVDMSNVSGGYQSDSPLGLRDHQRWSEYWFH